MYRAIIPTLLQVSEACTPCKRHIYQLDVFHMSFEVAGQDFLHVTALQMLHHWKRGIHTAISGLITQKIVYGIF